VSDEYVAQIATVKENPKVRSGDQYENWVANGPDHFFDCEKMLLALLDYAKQNLPAKYWKSGKPAWQPAGATVRLKPRGGAVNRQGSWLRR
jgi:hypothetical protein